MLPRVNLPNPSKMKPFVNPNDDDYLAQIAQYKNESWYSRLLENPWLNSMQSSFSPNLGQSFAMAFGDTSARDNYWSSIAQNRNQWLSDTLQQMHQQNYDSASEQVARERAAGLNPDLNGGITPGAASENDQPVTNVPMNDGTSGLESIASFGTSILNVAMNVVTGVQNVRSLFLDNAAKSLSVNTGFRDSAWSLIKDGISEFLNGNQVEPGTIYGNPQFVQSAAKYFAERLDKLPYSKREKRKLLPIVESLIKTTGEAGQYEFTNSFQQLMTDSFAAVADSRANASQAFGRPGADKDTVNAMRFVGNEIYKPLNDLQLKVNKLILQGDAAFNQEFNSPNEDGFSGPVLQARSNKANYAYFSGLNNIKKDVLDAFEEINRRITGSRDLSPGWKLGLQAGVSSVQAMFMAQISNGFPSLNFRGMIQNTFNNRYNTTNNM